MGNHDKKQLLDCPIENFGVLLQPLGANDLEQVRGWRNHPDVAQHMLDRQKITRQGQQDWFEKIKTDHSQKHYLIHYRSESIGVINIKAVDEQDLAAATTIEVGLYLAPESRYRGTVLAFCPALAINQLCFEQLGCQQLQATVLAENNTALRFNQQLGYRIVDSSDQLISMVMGKEDYQQSLASLSKVIRV